MNKLSIDIGHENSDGNYYIQKARLVHYFDSNLANDKDYWRDEGVFYDTSNLFVVNETASKISLGSYDSEYNQYNIDYANGTIQLDALNEEELSVFDAGTWDIVATKEVGDKTNDTIYGTIRGDSLEGLAGDDTYLVDHIDDLVFEKTGQGLDTIVSSVSYVLGAGQSVEILKLVPTGRAAINLTGNELANTLTDNAGNNRLDGGAGDDTLMSMGGRDVLIGGAGSDGAVIDRSGAKAGLSFIMTSVNGTTTLVGDGTTTTSIGNITLTGGSGNDTFTTLSGIDTLNGGAGDDVLNGGTGADRMSGGAGSDTFLVDNSADRVVEAVRGGFDAVLATVSYTLQAGQEIEVLQLAASTGRARLNLTGNALGQALLGNDGVNVLDGKGGADVMTGGKGADSFVFSTALGSGNVDRITDFVFVDTMRLSKSIFAALAPGALKANEFKDIGKGGKVDTDDHILYDSRNGNLFYDADGSGKMSAVKFAVLDNKAALTQADFLIA